MAINRTGRYVRVQLAGTNYLSIAEVQVWTGSATPPVQWLISDHLGTPRMILDHTGSLANMKRHDYLPFGEEIVVPISGRSAAQGYAGGDGVRQQFTQKERDVETGLDYFGARYYSPAIGRFTSADKILVDQAEINPQSWNLYSYSGNSPAVYTDPFGLWKKVPCSGAVSECWQAEDNDTYETLVRDADIGLPWKLLEAYFRGQPITPGVTVLDISGFEGVEATLGVKIVTADQIPGDRYSLEINIGPPLPGGGAIGRSAKRPAELVKKLNELRAKGYYPNSQHFRAGVIASGGRL